MAEKDFITYTPSTGNNNATISVTASENVEGSRNTTLIISGNGISKSINIKQKYLLPRFKRIAITSGRYTDINFGNTTLGTIEANSSEFPAYLDIPDNNINYDLLSFKQFYQSNLMKMFVISFNRGIITKITKEFADGSDSSAINVSVMQEKGFQLQIPPTFKSIEYGRRLLIGITFNINDEISYNLGLEYYNI